MKVRGGFVSNSSSSSFIVVGKKPDCTCIKLTLEQAHAIIKHIETRKFDQSDVEWSSDEDVFLTRFISGGVDLYGEVMRLPGAYHYCWGGHGGPYSEEYYDELSDPEHDWEEIWILKEHNVEKK
jgi:hypothetical protein